MIETVWDYSQGEREWQLEFRKCEFPFLAAVPQGRVLRTKTRFCMATAKKLPDGNVGSPRRPVWHAFAWHFRGEA